MAHFTSLSRIHHICLLFGFVCIKLANMANNIHVREKSHRRVDKQTMRVNCQQHVWLVVHSAWLIILIGLPFNQI